MKHLSAADAIATTKEKIFILKKSYFYFFFNFSDWNIWSEVIYRGWVHFWRLCKPLKMKLKCQKRCGRLEERLKDRFIRQVEKILYRISSGELKQMIFHKAMETNFWLFSFFIDSFSLKTHVFANGIWNFSNRLVLGLFKIVLS